MKLKTMGRKVLISFIGTGRLKKDNSPTREYDKAVYTYDGKRHETSFVTSALGQFLNIDTYFLFGTMKSMWEAVYMDFATQNGGTDDKYALKLYETCEAATYDSPIAKSLFSPIENVLGNGSIIVPIYYGITQESIQRNFEIFANTLEGHLQDGDEIFLDITHSFRSLPLFATTALSFITDVTDKKILLKGIYYGMLEVKSDFNNEVPVVNLSYINQLQEWIKGAYSFKHFGNSTLISGLLADKNKTASDKLKDFTNTISINFIHEIKSQIAVLKSLSNESDYELPERLIIPKTFKEFIRFFDGARSLSTYQFRLSQWHEKIGNTALSYLCLVEAIITFVCEKNNWNEKDKRKREKAKELIINENKYELSKIYGETNTIRKRIAHAIDENTKEGNMNNAVNSLKKYQQQFEKIMKANAN